MSARLATRIALLAATVTAAGLLTACGPKSTTGPTSTRESASTTVCRDGTHTTSTGRGTCSRHGGIRGGQRG